MIVAQLVEHVTSRFVPTSAPTLFAGQALTRANTLVTSTAGAGGVLGILQSDLPAFTVGPQNNGILFNNPRTVPVATNGRLAIRVSPGAVLAVGGLFGLVNGDAVAVGTGATVAATTIAGDTLIIDERVTGTDGFNYILVFLT